VLEVRMELKEVARAARGGRRATRQAPYTA